ncbi:MAG: AmmeMemoRadiSam system protein A, partial [Gammaproteobacteria bacterium]
MAHFPSMKHELTRQHRQHLLDIALESIRHGLRHDKPLVTDSAHYPSALREKRGLFVTLMLDGNLRGCIGNTEAVASLHTATADSAFNAAFRDPRFQRLTHIEYPNISLEISILTPKTAIRFDSDQSLLAQLQPGSDGLVIMKTTRSATFLPSVWDKISDPEEFLTLLKTKAGIKPDEVPEAAWTYQT